MGDSNPKVLTTDWDEWEHPKRAIAAIWISGLIVVVIFIFSLPVIFNLSIHPALAVVVAIVLIFLFIFSTTVLMSRLD